MITFEIIEQSTGFKIFTRHLNYKHIGYNNLPASEIIYAMNKIAEKMYNIYGEAVDFVVG